MNRFGKLRVLFCDDSGGVIKGFENQVARPMQELIETATMSSLDGVKALIAEGEQFDVVVTDLNFEKVGGGAKDGLEIIRVAREHWPEVEPILMTAYEGSLDFRDGLRLPALGLVEGSLLAKTDAEDPGVTWMRLRERLQGIATRKRTEGPQLQNLAREVDYRRGAAADDSVEWLLARTIPEAADAIRADPRLFLEGQAGKSFAMQEVFRKIRRVAALPSDVLILGPTGTGKDLVAHAIHRLSRRADKPFVKVDLTTTSGNLVESELFGHERGAFTGADARKEGLLRSAEGGTFFLDEIGNVAAEVQAKLLRVLEERRYRMLGSTKDQSANVRFIAATNVDLPAAVDEGRFRADLYERLNVVRIVLPPLHLRREDVPLLVALFVDDYRKKFECTGLTAIERDALQLLMDEEWPRNVRQLRHAIERLFAEVDLADPAIDRAAVDKVIERRTHQDPGALSPGEVWRAIQSGEINLPPAELKRRFGEEIVRQVMRQAMLHFHGQPSVEDCEQFFGGVKPNAWRQFAFQLGLTWRGVKESLS